ncbi:hypothetical protein [Actinacidiphila acididurans]|uniref:Hemerythrin-like domain-containing protein n=1 Tax=Actinacidiphila acididurans TaxID=2784346 RepID=A0ABS2TXS1_9ACTN|nr:hypothetical protein [Actinacidiphila acididurans]MBM9508140.1 hypothetical protein [Actinacidiphila acididurans]
MSGTREPGTGSQSPPDPARAHAGRLQHVFHRPGHKAPDRAGGPPEGLAASLVTSGGLLLAMVEDVRMREANRPEDLRLLADALARHNAAKEATVLKVLDRHHAAQTVVTRDRQEGTLLQGILDRALIGRHPSDTHTLTVDGALAQMYQYLFHERRDLVPALQRTIPAEESESLAAAFEAIDNE